MLQNSLTALVPATTDEWSDLAVATLLDCYNDKHIELNRGSIRAKGWQEVIAKVNSVCAEGKPVFTYRRCKNKLDVMKRRFKLENDRKISNGGAPSDWPWFQKLEQIMGRNPRYSGIPGGIASGERLTPALHKFHNGTLGFDQAEDGSQSPERASGAMQLGLKNEICHEVKEQICHSGTISALCNQTENKPNIADHKASVLPGVSRKGFRKKRKGSFYSPGRQAKEVARLVIEALEKIELRRIEVMREMEIRRHETQLQIVKMIVESNMHSNARFFNHQHESNCMDSQQHK